MLVIEIYLLLHLLDDSLLPLEDLREKILQIHSRRPPRILPAGKHRRRPALEIEWETIARIWISKFLGIKISFSLSLPLKKYFNFNHYGKKKNFRKKQNFANWQQNGVVDANLWNDGVSLYPFERKDQKTLVSCKTVRLTKANGMVISFILRRRRLYISLSLRDHSPEWLLQTQIRS